MPKDKEGNKLTWKEFFKRWKSGIEGITPQQRIKAQINGTGIMLLGLFLGLIVTTFAYKTLWWVMIVLFGGIINTSIQYMTLKQQYKILDSMFNIQIEEEKEYGRREELNNQMEK